MANAINNQSDPRKLDDVELDEVVGGLGYWSPWSERVKKRTYVHADTSLSFEDWLKARESEDRLQARAAWLADGSPQDRTYYFDKDHIWTEPYVD